MSTQAIAARAGCRSARSGRGCFFAFNLMDVNILLTDYITPDSSIQIRRSFQDRVHRIAPFLLLDRDPYMVTTRGRAPLDPGRLHHL